MASIIYNMKDEIVKLKGPWVNGKRTTIEMPRSEWASKSFLWKVAKKIKLDVQLAISRLKGEARMTKKQKIAWLVILTAAALTQLAGGGAEIFRYWRVFFLSL